jgi:hypothetical protein
MLWKISFIMEVVMCDIMPPKKKRKKRKKKNLYLISMVKIHWNCYR